MPERFYLLSLKWSPGLGGNALTWWRPNRAGYTAFLESAGVYTAEECAAIVTGREARRHILPVPCEVADSMASRIVHSEMTTILQKKALEAMREERCEYNPHTQRPAADGEPGQCLFAATLSVGVGKNNIHLCDSCAAMPEFKRFRARTVIKREV